jgi:hypothetical protein
MVARRSGKAKNAKTSEKMGGPKVAPFWHLFHEKKCKKMKKKKRHGNHFLLI